MMDINERQDQVFTSRSNMYFCDNNERELYLLGVNALVQLEIQFVAGLAHCNSLFAGGSAAYFAVQCKVTSAIF